MTVSVHALWDTGLKCNWRSLADTGMATHLHVHLGKKSHTPLHAAMPTVGYQDSAESRDIISPCCGGRHSYLPVWEGLGCKGLPGVHSVCVLGPSQR